MGKEKKTAESTDRNQYKKRSQLGAICRRFAKSKTAMAGLIVLLILVAVAVLCPLFLSYSDDVIKQNMRERLQAPSLAHLFGTDQYGRDVLYRVIWGTRISLSASLVIIAIATVFGALFGAIAAYYGGMVDNVIMRIMDIFLAVPSLLLSITIVSALGPSIFNLMLAIAISSVPGYARIVRASVLTVKDQEFVEAAKCIGANNFEIISSHILPNCMAPIIVQVSLKVASAILSTSGLSFLGLGVKAPTPEWGAMLSGGRAYLRNAPHLTVFPGIAIIITILSLNLLGDGLRDALDPKLKK